LLTNKTIAIFFTLHPFSVPLNLIHHPDHEPDQPDKNNNLILFSVMGGTFVNANKNTASLSKERHGLERTIKALLANPMAWMTDPIYNVHSASQVVG